MIFQLTPSPQRVKTTLKLLLMQDPKKKVFSQSNSLPSLIKIYFQMIGTLELCLKQLVAQKKIKLL